MKNITALIDINIIYDDLLEREPWMTNAHEILKLCARYRFCGYISEHTLPTLFYLLHKHGVDNDVIREKMLRLCKVMEIATVTKYAITSALENKAVKDFEDCLQIEAAKAVEADYIITRNIKDFSASNITAILPENFLQMFAEVQA
jgi:predicted nucleic acid-binding protein